MKKIILTIAIVIATTTAFSQVTFKPGARAGVNLANITNTVSEKKTDFYIGGFLEMKFADFYSLQPEVNYSRQGSNPTNPDFEKLEIQYIGLHLVNKFTPVKDFGFQVMVGPFFNFKLNDNYKESDLEAFDIGLLGGLGYSFPFGLAIEARYSIGFVDILGNNVNGTASGSEIYLNNVIQLGAAYKFDF